MRQHSIIYNGVYNISYLYYVYYHDEKGKHTYYSLVPEEPYQQWWSTYNIKKAWDPAVTVGWDVWDNI